MHENSRIRLLLTVTTLLPQFYRTYTTEDIGSFSLVSCCLVCILSTVWLMRMYSKEPQNIYGLCEIGVISLFYGFITIHILLQRTGKRKIGKAKDEDNIVSNDYLKEIIGDTLFSGLESV